MPRPCSRCAKWRMALKNTVLRCLADGTWVDSCVTSAIHTASCAGSKSSSAVASSLSWSPSTTTRFRSLVLTLADAAAYDAGSAGNCGQHQAHAQPSPQPECGVYAAVNQKAQP